MRYLAIVLLFVGCAGNAEQEPKPDAGKPDAGNDWIVGGPCAVNVQGDCEIHACWGVDGGVETRSYVILNDAGPNACEGATWP